jgi:surface polysaccharide O-acyltransferase-like enzyme
LREVSETTTFASPTVQNVIRRLASAAFGIYLVHVLVIEALLSPMHLDSFIDSPLWSIPLISGIVLVISFSIIHLLQKIPVIKQTVP